MHPGTSGTQQPASEVSVAWKRSYRSAVSEEVAVLAQVTNGSVDLSRLECKEGIQAPSYSLHQSGHAICVSSYFDLSSRVSRLLILATNGFTDFQGRSACLFIPLRTHECYPASVDHDRL
jgi:hypothetical protein